MIDDRYCARIVREKHNLILKWKWILYLSPKGSRFGKQTPIEVGYAITRDRAETKIVDAYKRHNRFETPDQTDYVITTDLQFGVGVKAVSGE